MTNMLRNLRTGFDSLPAARNVWGSAWRKAGEAYREYARRMPEEADALAVLDAMATAQALTDEELLDSQVQPDMADALEEQDALAAVLGHSLDTM